MRYVTAGDSHGEYLVGIIEGFPAGHRINVRDIERDLARRRQAYGRSARQKIESDTIHLVSGVWKGRSTGAPIAILVPNLGRRVSGKPGGALGSVPRPGHADWPGCLKYGLDEVPPVSERASARETTLRVAVGSLAKSLLRHFSIEVLGHVVTIGDIDATHRDRHSFRSLKSRVTRSPVFCADGDASKRMVDAIREAKKGGYSLGGAAEVVATGVVPGLGTYATASGKLDARLAAALMSIQSAKAVEIGDGLQTYRRHGPEAQDAFVVEKNRVSRGTNRAGGIEGGTTNGEDVVVRVYAKPIPTSLERLPSFDMRNGKPKPSPFVRADACVLPPLSVIAEAAVAWEILVAMGEKFGSDSVADMEASYRHYRNYLRGRGIR